MKKILTTIIAVLSVFTLGAHLALAADELTQTKPPIIPTGTNTQKTTVGSDISTLKLPGVGTEQAKQGAYLQENVLPMITNIVIGLTGGLSLLFTIISGIQILTAYGNEEKIGEGKKTLTWSLLGLLIAMLSYAIVQIIVSIRILPK